jgi:hypothetical protein
MELLPRNDFEPLSGDDIIKDRELLANAIELGIQSAKNDKCQLVFRSWNATAKMCGVDNENQIGPTNFDTMARLDNAMKLNHKYPRRQAGNQHIQDSLHEKICISQTIQCGL